MRTSLKVVVPLIVSVAFVSLLFAAYQVRTERRVLRAWDDLPRYEDIMNSQIAEVIAKRGQGDLAKLLRAGDTWEVK